MPWYKHRWVGKLVVLAIALLYLGSVVRNASESKRRSLNLIEEGTGDNRVLIVVDITSIVPGSRQLTAQLGFRFAGDLRQDEQTPKVNLRFLVNNIAGQQEFEFPKGKRLGRIEVTFPMDGDVNKYPFDKYLAYLRFIVTRAGSASAPTIVSMPQSQPEGSARPGELKVDEGSFHGQVPVSLSVSTSASIPGIKFSRDASPASEPNVTKVDLKIQRPQNLIVVSLFVMVLMMSLALSVLMMALNATRADKKFDLLPLSLSLSLIFGLPALRNIQPGVPPVGALADYVSFIWAEVCVAVSAIIVMWTWLSRIKQELPTHESSQSRIDAHPRQLEKLYDPQRPRKAGA